LPQTTLPRHEFFLDKGDRIESRSTKEVEMKVVGKFDKEGLEKFVNFIHYGMPHARDRRVPHETEDGAEHLGAGHHHHEDGGRLVYTTGSGAGRYIFAPDEGLVTFTGWRNSFKDGTEFFWANPVGPNHLWFLARRRFDGRTAAVEGEIIGFESTQPWRGIKAGTRMERYEIIRLLVEAVEAEDCGHTLPYWGTSILDHLVEAQPEDVQSIPDPENPESGVFRVILDDGREVVITASGNVTSGREIIWPEVTKE
jgi:hypothetical protein